MPSHKVQHIRLSGRLSISRSPALRFLSLALFAQMAHAIGEAAASVPLQEMQD